MAITVTYLGHWYFWSFVLLLGIIALIIWVCVKEKRRRCSSNPCSDKRNNKNGCKDSCDSSSSSSCTDSCDSRRRGCFDWFSWGNNNRGNRKLDRAVWYLTSFFVFVILGLLAHLPCWEGIVFSIVWVIVIEIFKCCSRWFRRYMCKVKWYQLLVVIVVGYLIGLLLATMLCWFPPPTYCCGVSSSIGYAVEYNGKTGLPIASAGNAVVTKSGLFG